MRFIIANEFYQQMLQTPDHTPDCYVRPGEYLHHMYIDGVKYTIAPAVANCLAQAEERNDREAIEHLRLHQLHFEGLLADAERAGTLTDDVTLLGDAPPTEEEGNPNVGNAYTPRPPAKWEDLGLELPYLFDLALRIIYTRGQVAGGELANAMTVPFAVMNPVFQLMRKQVLIDIVSQKGSTGDASFVYAIKPPKGEDALRDSLDKTTYVGPTPVPFADYVESVMAQTIKRMVVTRRSIQRAFQDLIITDEVFNEIGPAINSAQSIFFFGFPGNGKTSVAERITRLMGDAIYVPHAVEANGQIIKVFDPILHTPVLDREEQDAARSILKTGTQYDQRYIKVKRPTIVVGGELVMPMLDLRFNPVGKFYEAPLQMKANGGIFMIDDFGRQQVRAIDLLNRWIVPLEKKYDYLNTINGT
ncbi:MAG: ATP-binding protein, partial [Planctomycetia bacterium]|nr:ATP-binding protein [Planctomycetia bacterium]